MRIIRKGQLPGDRLHTAKCNYCKTEVEFRESEAEYKTGGRNDSYFVITCPFCQKPIWWAT